ncbi:testis-specific Y-encoded-like protein 1 [Tamandua tetradactyla]|uniref:testis-specific Y-encoded-like protein 1 n=1 Tax=Tamandua tetradactyla TaxID=48850 RepID=UPI004053A858
MALRMNALEAIQRQMEAEQARANRVLFQMERRFGRMRRHYLERRKDLIQDVANFWFIAFSNHPQLSTLLKGQDAEMLRYITSLEVTELAHPRLGNEFKFYFENNPFFINSVLIKEYELRLPNRLVARSTPIMWREGQVPQVFVEGNRDITRSFFFWFTDQVLLRFDQVAAVIKEDLWLDPLQYYLLQEGVPRIRHVQIGEVVEIPRPFGFHSG